MYNSVWQVLEIEFVLTKHATDPLDKHLQVDLSNAACFASAGLPTVQEVDEVLGSGLVGPRGIRVREEVHETVALRFAFLPHHMHRLDLAEELASLYKSDIVTSHKKYDL